MAGILEGRILESFLESLKGKYKGFATGEWDLVLRLSDDNLLNPERSVLKVVTLGMEQPKQFCLTTVLGGRLENRYDLRPEQLGAISELSSRALNQVVLIGVGTRFSPKGWYELVYARTPSKEFDLRDSFLETLKRYNSLHTKP